jgi:hypothetical protein
MRVAPGAGRVCFGSHILGGRSTDIVLPVVFADIFFTFSME